MKTLIQELQDCIRQLRQSPAFTMAAVLTLAAGIGANSASLLGPLLYEQRTFDETRSAKTGRQTPGVTGGEVMDLRAQSELLEDFSTTGGGEVGDHLKDLSAFTGVMFIDSDLPRIFGIKPVFGRLLREKESKISALVSQPLRRTISLRLRAQWDKACAQSSADGFTGGNPI
jgi:putative ABC transport system permease protein